MTSDNKLPAHRTSDLRRHPRFPIGDAVVRLTKNGLLSSIGGNKSRGAVNLSEGGILVRASERMAEGAKVRVTLDLEQFGDHLVSGGEVRWCAEAARAKNEFYVGVRFNALPAEDVKKIGRMRKWFTSEEYRLKKSTKRRVREG